MELRQRLLGQEHPDKALEIAEHSLGVNHPNTATIHENLKSLRAHYPEQQSS